MDDDILDCARRAEDAIRRLARITIDRPSLTPADIDVVIASLAEAVAALPPTVTQLGDMLHNAADDGHLIMDSMSGTSDPTIAIDTARLHLDAVRRPAVEVYSHLNAAHQDTAHIAADVRLALAAPEPTRPAMRPEHRQPPSEHRHAGAQPVALIAGETIAIVNAAAGGDPTFGSATARSSYTIPPRMTLASQCGWTPRPLDRRRRSR